MTFMSLIETGRKVKELRLLSGTDSVFTDCLLYFTLNLIWSLLCICLGLGLKS